MSPRSVFSSEIVCGSNTFARKLSRPLALTDFAQLSKSVARSSTSPATFSISGAKSTNRVPRPWPAEFAADSKSWRDVVPTDWSACPNPDTLSAPLATAVSRSCATDVRPPPVSAAAPNAAPSSPRPTVAPRAAGPSVTIAAPIARISGETFPSPVSSTSIFAVRFFAASSSFASSSAAFAVRSPSSRPIFAVRSRVASSRSASAAATCDASSVSSMPIFAVRSRVASSSSASSTVVSAPGVTVACRSASDPSSSALNASENAWPASAPWLAISAFRSSWKLEKSGRTLKNAEPAL